MEYNVTNISQEKSGFHEGSKKKVKQGDSLIGTHQNVQKIVAFFHEAKIHKNASEEVKDEIKKKRAIFIKDNVVEYIKKKLGDNYLRVQKGEIQKIIFKKKQVLLLHAQNPSVEKEVKDIFKEIKILINKAKEELEYEDIQAQIEASLSYNKMSSKTSILPTNVGVGIEFTFTNNKLKNLSQQPERSLEEDAEYERLVLMWIKKVTSLAQANGLKNVECVKTQNRKTSKDPKERLETQYTITFALSDGNQWAYKVTQDPGCLEIVTEPSSASSYDIGEVAEIIDTYIYSVASSFLDTKTGEDALQADPEFGGGHINIDKGVFSEPGSLRKFLKAFFEDEDHWKGDDPDAINAPFPSEIESIPKENRKKINNALDDDTLSDDDLLKVLNVNLFNYCNISSNQRDGKSSSHYHAVNLEHYNEQGGTARIEIRRVPAHAKRQDLVQRLTRIFKLMR